MEQALWSQICTPDELGWLHEHNAAARLGTVLFSAKETAYKAVHPFIRTVLEFSDVELRIDAERQVFSCQVLHPAGAALPELSGHYRELPECVMTLISDSPGDGPVTDDRLVAPGHSLD